MRRNAYEPSLPTRGTKVPSGPDWIHEIKHDGYRLIVQREGERVRVRLFTKGGHDWTDRFPLIVESARRMRSSHFVLDGEAVVLGVDDGLDHSTVTHSKDEYVHRKGASDLDEHGRGLLFDH